MLISIILLSVFGLLLLAADGLAQVRLRRPQVGLIRLVGLAVPRWDGDGGRPPTSAMGENRDKALFGLNRSVEPQTGKRS